MTYMTGKIALRWLQLAGYNAIKPRAIKAKSDFYKMLGSVMKREGGRVGTTNSFHHAEQIAWQERDAFKNL